MDNENYVTLSKYSCDSCESSESPTALYHHRGEPVLAQCRRCDPAGWDRAGRYAREQWMAGITPDGCQIVG